MVIIIKKIKIKKNKKKKLYLINIRSNFRNN